MTTWGYLERARALNGACSDYRLAQIIGVKQPSFVAYRKGREMDDDVAARVAVLLDLPPLKVIADVRAARAAAEGAASMVEIWNAAAAMVMRSIKPAALRVSRSSSATATATSSATKKKRKWRPTGTHVN